MTEEHSTCQTKNDENVEVIHELNLEVPKGRYCTIAVLKSEAKFHRICISKSSSSQ